MRYWSWLFAAPAARDPLVAVYALAAEWRALMDPATEASAAHFKLIWWRDEIGRLATGSPLHPVTRYLAALPHAASADLPLLLRAIDAAAAHIAGVPLERASELEAHADALYGTPLRVASQLADPRSPSAAVHACTTALAAADYLTRAIADYGRDARVGRIPFPVDELLAAQIDNEDLAAAVAPPRLQRYLQELRQRAARHFAAAAKALSGIDAPSLRHLAVLTTLSANHAATRNSRSTDFRLADLYNAWSAARRNSATR